MASDLFEAVEVLTFDCYGTLIDWERGILAALRRALPAAARSVPDDQLLASFARHESALEAGDYLPYREILGRCLVGICADLGIERPTGEVLARFGGSVADWPAFPDSAASLARLARRYRLGVITNCDDDLFASSNERLGKPFEWIVTAQQAGRYKPDRRPFEIALQRIGLPTERVMHVAQSLYHDHRPARAMGLKSVWIDRRRGRPGFGATPPAEAAPLLTLPDMATFARLALAPHEGAGTA